MSQPALARLGVLLAAIACLLVAFGVLRNFRTAGELAPAPVVIVNDTAQAVVVVRCAGACPAGPGTPLEPGREVPAGLPHATWQVRTPAGEVLGCVAASSAGQHLSVSRARPCPS